MEKPCLAIIPYVEFDLNKLINKYNITQYNINNNPLASLSPDILETILLNINPLKHGIRTASALRGTCTTLNTLSVLKDFGVNNCPLVTLAPEMLEIVLSKIKSLEDAMKTALALRRTCATFNELPLEHFGKAYQHHDPAEKTQMLKNIIAKINDFNYKYKRFGALILIGANAKDNSSYSFMSKTVLYNDEEALTFLLKKGSNPDQKNYAMNPTFFNAKKCNILEIFKKHGTNFNQGGPTLPNVLWSTILHNPSSELIKFYLDNHVNATIIDSSNGDCLLHFLVKHPGYNMQDINDYVKIGALLLKKAPKLVNALNNKEKTPIDAARKYNQKALAHNSDYAKANKKLIFLFKQLGGKTAKQLKAQNLINQLKEFSQNDYSKE